MMHNNIKEYSYCSKTYRYNLLVACYTLMIMIKLKIYESLGARVLITNEFNKTVSGRLVFIIFYFTSPLRSVIFYRPFYTYTHERS